MLHVDVVNFRQERCIFPVITTFFFTALSGEQARKKLSRYKKFHQWIHMNK